MAMPLALVWDLIATDNASGVFKRVSKEAAVAGKESEGLGKSFAKAGGVVAIAAIGIAAVTVKMAADFQEATTLLVTGAGESEKNIDMVRKGLLAMAPAVGIGPTALAKAMFMVESAGYHGAQGLLVMKAAAEGAKVGGADATVVANGLTTALTDYHLPASQAAEVTSKLVATVAAGKTNMGDLSGALAGVLPFASAVGVGFNNIMGAMATMTSHGIDAATTSTMLKFTMMSLANEVPKGAKALLSVGLSAAIVHNSLGTKGLSGTLEMVTEAIGKKFPKGSYEATHALSAIVGGIRGMGATLALTGANMTTYNKNIKDIGAATTEAGGHVKGWAETQKDFNVQLDKAKAAVAAFGIKIGTALLPHIQDALALGVKWTDWASKHGDIVKVVATAIGGVLVVAVAAYTVSMIQAAVATIAATWPILLVIAAVAALAAGLVYAWQHCETFRTVVTDVFHGIQVVIGKVVEVIVTIFRGMLATWTTVIGGIIGAAASIAEKLHLPFAKGLRDASNEFNKLSSAADDKLKSIADSAGHWGEQIPPKMAAGMDSNQSMVLTSAGRIAVAARNNLFFNAEPVGASVAAGFASGIQNGAGPVMAAALAVAGSAQATMAAALKVHSPSQVFHELGTNVGQGFANGMLSTIGMVGAASSRLAASSVPRFGTLDFGSSAQRAAAAGGPTGGDTFNIYEAVSAQATAMQVSRRQAALGAI